MSFRGAERRKHPRYDFSDTIEYRVNPASLDNICSGLILNISESGICFYTSTSLNIGQDLIIKTSLQAPVVRARITWVKEYRDDLFKVGAMFIP